MGGHIRPTGRNFDAAFKNETLIAITALQACNTNDPENYKKMSRDPERTPFQWDDSENAGFCESCKPWLPVHENYDKLNLASQTQDEDSFFKFYKRLSKLRTNVVFQKGDFETYAFNDEIFAFKRSYEGKTYVVLINFSAKQHTININDMTKELSAKAKVVIVGSRSCHSEGDILETNNFVLKGYNALVFENSAAAGIYSLALLILAFVTTRFL